MVHALKTSVALWPVFVDRARDEFLSTHSPKNVVPQYQLSLTPGNFSSRVFRQFSVVPENSFFPNCPKFRRRGVELLVVHRVVFSSLPEAACRIIDVSNVLGPHVETRRKLEQPRLGRQLTKSYLPWGVALSPGLLSDWALEPAQGLRNRRLA